MSNWELVLTGYILGSITRRLALAFLMYFDLLEPSPGQQLMAAIAGAVFGYVVWLLVKGL